MADINIKWGSMNRFMIPRGWEMAARAVRFPAKCERERISRSILGREQAVYQAMYPTIRWSVNMQPARRVPLRRTVCPNPQRNGSMIISAR